MRLRDQTEAASRHYDLLVKQTLRFLLGWLLPRPASRVRVHVFLEAMEQLQHPQGDDRTEFFRGILAADLDRFIAWEIATVQWAAKNFGYIPYADLIGYLTLEHTPFNQALGAWADFKSLPGYMPFSLDLVPRLERLEHLESAGNLQDVIDFASENADSPFGRLVMADIKQRLQQRPDLQLTLLQQLEQGYQEKIPDLQRLRRAFAAVRTLLPALPEQASAHMRLLWYLLALQDANHDGDPQRSRDVAGYYRHERASLKHDARELCAYADLHLAVHYADRFEFETAAALIEDWLHDPLLPALSWHQQGRLRSALGQYYAILNAHQEAEQLFVAALECFEQAGLTARERQHESEQTRIYRAFNALAGALPVAREALEESLGPLTPATAQQYARNHMLHNQYRHHLWLRTLCDWEHLTAAREGYLAAYPHWQAGYPQYPWPAIHGHRGFLLWNWGEVNRATVTMAQTEFDRAIAVARHGAHGPTVRLIGAMWATVAACCFVNANYEAEAEALLASARSLPAAGEAIATLQNILAAPEPQAIPTAWTVLPFNYR